MTIMTAKKEEEWGWPENLASLYICAPAILFIFSWFRPILALFCGLPYLYILLKGITPPPRIHRHSATQLGICILFALLWVLLSGINGLFYANAYDWVIRYALAHDLTMASWPTEYSSNTQIYVLRSTLGFFIIPCAIAKALGTQFLTNLLMIWSWFGVTLTFLIAFKHMKWQQLLLAILIFSLGSGLDFIGTIALKPDNLYYGSHIEWWLGGLQYSSNTTQLFWVPNHALAAWLATAMLFRHQDSSNFFLKIVPIVPALMLWSPLSGGGFVLLLVASKVKILDAARLRSFIPRALPCAPCALLVFLYLASGVSGVKSQTHPHEYSALVTIERSTVFFLIEVGAYIFYVVSRKKFMRLSPAFVILAALPYFSFGAANDLVMRASIPALAYLWFWLAYLASDRQYLLTNPIKGALFYIPFLVGAVTPLHEVERSISLNPWNPDFSLSLPEAFLEQGSSEEFPAHYFVKADTIQLNHLLSTPSKIQATDPRKTARSSPKFRMP